MQLRHLLIGLFAMTTSCLAGAQPNYHRLEFSIAIDRPAAEVWAKVGGYCDIGVWFDRDCEITQGDGGIGTVRVLDGTIVEPMVAQTELSYGYTQPAVEGQYYTLYHGFMEARPVTASTSQVIYTVMWDISQSSAEQVAADTERRSKLFTAALAKMKEIAEQE
ncbi:MAG: SRPBCC family protein [Gammaproteobacteria bacterium]|nr:SRPBCC family protein [Gammaproteobacteria bacterium]MDH5304663.1 SRPBCC family protein [Gammaproteobacteria bacterium]MDH5323010.1 SRPBCC family protein [Gammaproteobacteria bacterium]